jgi:hypothetical protein
MSPICQNNSAWYDVRSCLVKMTSGLTYSGSVSYLLKHLVW